MTEKEIAKVSSIFDDKMSLIDEKLKTVDEKLKGLRIQLEGNLQAISIDLSHIKEQTTKTNSRVNHMEDDIRVIEKEVRTELPHTIDGCPQKDTINEIHKAVIEYKAVKLSKEKLNLVFHSDKVRILMIVGIVISILVSIANIYFSDRNRVATGKLKTELNE